MRFTLIGKALQEHALLSTFVSVTFIFLWPPMVQMFVAMQPCLVRYIGNVVWGAARKKIYDP